MANLFGILVFHHDEIDDETVRFEDIGTMELFLRQALKAGTDVNTITGYVPDEASALRLQDAAREISGLRPPMYDING